MIPQEFPVFVPWNGKMLQGSLISENYMMGMAAVRIPLQGCHPIALFAPGHVYRTPQEAGIAESVPKIEENVPKIEENVPRISEATKCEAFKKSHWDHAHNHLMIDALNEFYSLWKAEHTPSGDLEKPVPPPSQQAAAPPRHKSPIQLSLFE